MADPVHTPPAWPLASRIWIGAEPATVELSQVHALAGLSVRIEPARAPVLRWSVAGDPAYFFPPGSTRRAVTIAGAGRQVPNLGGLTLSAAVPVTIEWPHGTSTVLSMWLPEGVKSRDSDQRTALVSWTLSGIGTVTSGEAVP